MSAASPCLRTETVSVLETPDLGNRTYIVSDGNRAAVVDPPRDFDRVLAACNRQGLTIDWVLETHVHNDYVSGGAHLARTVGARYGVSAAEAVDYPRVALRDGAELAIGELRVRVVAAPGHTFGHVAYTVAVEGQITALLSGGSLLFGAVGRTDLCGADQTQTLTGLQYRTVRSLVDALPPDVALYPTHGFGSGCAVGRTGTWTSGRLRDEAERNPVFLADSEAAFADGLLGGLYPPPRSYARIGPLNRRAQQPIDLSPPLLVTAHALRGDLARGAWAVDVRDRWMFTQGHIPGTINVPLQRGFAEWLGRVLPIEARVALVADNRTQLEQAQRALARLGIDRPLVAVVLHGAGEEGTAGVLQPQPVASFQDLAYEIAAGDAPVVVDVRRPDEVAGGHLVGAHTIPLDDLTANPGQIPPGRVWVHCAAGFRAGMAASVLSREGRETVVIDDAWEHAAETSPPLPIVNPGRG